MLIENKLVQETKNVIKKWIRTDIHLYREDGRDVWCNMNDDGNLYDGRGNCYQYIKPTLYMDGTGEYLYSAAFC